MAASGVRVTMIMRSGDYAVTETHTLTTANTLAEAELPAMNLMKARMDLSGFGTVAKGMRLSKEGVFRDSRLMTEAELRGLNPALDNQLRKKGGRLVDNASDEAKACYLLRAEANEVKRKPIFLAGIPDEVIFTSPEEDPRIVQPWWKALWDAYKTLLETAGWGFVAKGVPPQVPPATNAADVIVQQGTNRIGIVTAGAIGGITVGSTIQARGFRRTHVAYNTLNGEWQVSTILTDSPAAGQTTYVLRNSENVPVDQITKLGTIERLEFFTYKYSLVKLNKPTTRRRGNRVLVGPGRRRIKKPLPV
jgi:hypothetical protein